MHTTRSQRWRDRRARFVPAATEVGETVDVFFDPNAPQNAMLDAFFSLWGGAAITGGLGLVFLLVTAGLLFMPASAPAKRRRPR